MSELIYKINGLEFRKSAASKKYCGCVGVAKDGDNFHVTNVTNKGPVASFTQHEWEMFIDGVKKGEFDNNKF